MALPIEQWGPTCARCGSDEFRIDGYCTIECRNLAEVEAELAQVRAELEEVRRYEHRTARKLDDLLTVVKEHERDAGAEGFHADNRLYAVARRIREGQQ